MKGDLGTRRHSYTDATRYMVYVLWLNGFSVSKVAASVGLRTKQVAGIVVRSEYTNRAAMTLEQRNAFLAELLEIRENEDGSLIDGGKLALVAFQARPLRGEPGDA